MATIARISIVCSVLCLFLVGSAISIASPVDAASGSITIAPGETRYLSFGTCAAGDLILWDLEISTWSTIFEYWLQKPDGTHISLYSLTWGQTVNVAGEWKLGFRIDESGWWSATVYYTTYRTTPRIDISTPSNSSYLNEAQVDVSGTVDGFADSVAVSIDGVHYSPTDLYLGNWNGKVTLVADGANTVYAEATLVWGSYVIKYRDSVTVTLDRDPPEVIIVLPGDNGLVRGNYVDISWQCSDGCGIALTEMKIDGWGWSEVEGTSYSDLRLSTGSHTIQIRVTDRAGNQATDSTTFSVDARVLSFDGPYYGVPLIGIVLGAVIAAVAIIALFRRRRGGAAAVGVPEETGSEQLQEGDVSPE